MGFQKWVVKQAEEKGQCPNQTGIDFKDITSRRQGDCNKTVLKGLVNRETKNVQNRANWVKRSGNSLKQPQGSYGQERHPKRHEALQHENNEGGLSCDGTTDTVCLQFNPQIQGETLDPNSWCCGKT
jgi:hypothetical protein